VDFKRLQDLTILEQNSTYVVKSWLHIAPLSNKRCIGNELVVAIVQQHLSTFAT